MLVELSYPVWGQLGCAVILRLGAPFRRQLGAQRSHPVVFGVLSPSLGGSLVTDTAFPDFARRCSTHVIIRPIIMGVTFTALSPFQRVSAQATAMWLMNPDDITGY